MTGQWGDSQERATNVSGGMPATPLLYLSSVQSGWEGLVAQAFHEPAQLEGWVAPAMSDISLILFMGGAMRMEWRQANGAWKTLRVHQEDLILRPGVDMVHEVRWE